MYTKTAADVICPDHVEKVDHNPGGRLKLIPQETRKLPPLGHFSHFFLILRCALEGFYKRDVGQCDDFGAFEEFPDGVGCEDEADVANVFVSA